MLSPMRSMFLLIRRCALLMLAFSVFALGLQARLALCRSSAPMSVTSAKVSTEKRSAQVLESLEQRDEATHPSDRDVVAELIARAFVIPVFESLTDRAEIGLFAPTRLERSGNDTLHRPPPSVA
jgi:hypothetical protein